MSAIDERVVRMEFDNKQFESNIKESIKSLDDLDKQLGLLDDNDTFEEIDKKSKKIDFSHMLSGLDKVSEGFNALEIIAIGALTKIGSKIVDVVSQYAGLFTIKQIGAGWQKFADYSTATQKTLAATEDSWEKEATDLARIEYLTEELGDKAVATNLNNLFNEFEKGAISIDEVSKKLGITKTDLQGVFEEISAVQNSLTHEEFVERAVKQLNWYSDETSYNFTDMVSTLGKYTQIGKELNSSVTSIQGMMNLVAIAGGNAQIGVRAAEQFSQAYSKGYLSTEDYKPLKNMNIITLQYKEALIQTALELGTITEAQDEFGNTVYKTGKSVFTAVQGFDAALKEGWATTEVMDRTFAKYGEFSTKLYDVTERFGTTATDTLSLIDEYYSTLGDNAKQDDIVAWNEKMADMFGEDAEAVAEFQKALEELGSEQLKFSRRAFEEAQAAKTFRDAIDATVDAVSTKWMEIFKYMFGSSERAKEFWSVFTETLYKIFAEPLDGILDIFKKVSDSASVIDEETGEAVDAFELFRRSLVNVQKALLKIISPIREAFNEVFLSNVVDKINELSIAFNIFTDNLIISDTAAEKVKNIFTGLFTVIKSIFSIIGGAIKIISPLLGLIRPMVNLIVTLTSKLFDLMSAIGEVFDLKIGSFADSVSDVVGTAVGWIIEKIDSLSEWIDKHIDRDKMIRFLTSIKNAFVSAWKEIERVANNVWESISMYLPTMDEVRDAIQSIWNNIKEFLPTWDELIEGLKIGWQVFKQVADVIWNFLKPYIEQVAIAFGKFWGSVSTFIVGFMKADDKIQYLKDHIMGLVNAFLEWKRNSKFLKWVIERFNDLKKVISDIFGFFKDKGEGVAGKQLFGIFYLVASLAALYAIMSNVSKIAKGFKNITTAIKKFSSMLNKVVVFVGIYLLVRAITELIDVLTEFSKLRFDQVLTGVGSVILLGLAILAFAAILKEIIKKMTIDDVTVFRKVCVALGIALIAIAGSLFIVSKADSSDLGWKTLNIIGLLAAIIAAAYALSKYVGKVSFNNLATMIVLAAVVLAAAFAIEKIGKLSEEDFEKAKNIILIIGGFALAATLVCTIIAKGAEAFRNIGIGVAAMAGALLLIVLSLYMLKDIEIDMKIIGMIAVVLVVLTALAAIPTAMAIFAKRAETSSKDMLKAAATVDAMSVALIIIAAAIGIMANAMGKNNLSSGEMLSLAGVLGIIMVALAAMVALMAYAASALNNSNVNEMQKIAKSVRTMTTSIILMAAAIVVLTKLNVTMEGVEDALNIVISIMVLLAVAVAAMAGAARLAGDKEIQSGPIIAFVLGVVAIMAAMLVLSKALEKDGNQIQEAFKMIGWIAAGLAGLELIAGIATAIADGKIQTGPILVLVAGIIGIMHMLIIMSAADQEAIRKSAVSVGIVAGALAALLIAVGILQKLSSSTGNTLRSIALIIAVVAGIFAICYAIKEIKDVDNIVQIVLSIGGLLAALGVVFGLLGTLGVADLFGAALVLAIGAALLMLGKAAQMTAEALPALADGVVMLGDAIETISFSWEQLGKLAVALLELSVLGVPAMIGLSVAGLIFAAAFVVLGAGLAIVSAVLPSLSIGIMMMGIAMSTVSGQTIVQALELAVAFGILMAGGVALGIGLAAAGAGLLVVGAAALVIASAIAIAALAVSTLVTSFALLAEGIALVVDVFKGGNLTAQIKGFSDSVKDSSSKISGSITEINDSLSSVGNNSQFSLSGISLDNLNFDVSGLKDKLQGSLTGSGGIFGGDFSSMLSGDLLNSFTGGIQGMDMSSITGMLGDTFGSGVDGVDFGAIFGDSFSTDFAGFDYTSMLTGAGFGDGVTSSITDVAGTVDTTEASNTVVDNFAQGLVSPANMSSVETAGTTLGTKVSDGINSTSTNANNAGKNVGSSGAEGASSAQWQFYYAGSNAGAGFVNGISSNISSASSAGISLAVAAYQSAMRYLQERSPSRLFMKVGGYVSEGFAIGIGEKTSYAVNSVKEMALQTVGTATQILADTIENDYSNPVIRPTLDLSNVSAGASKIGSLFGRPTVGVNGVYSNSAGLDENIQNGGYVVNNFNIYPTANQSVDDIANAVERKLNRSYAQRKAAGLS